MGYTGLSAHNFQAMIGKDTGLPHDGGVNCELRGIPASDGSEDKTLVAFLDGPFAVSALAVCCVSANLADP